MSNHANLKTSPFAPARFPELRPVAGVRLATGNTGMRYTGRPDVLLVELPAGTAVAGATTRSLASSAPVDWCRSVLPRGSARGLVVNAGNANAFTGSAGRKATKGTAAAAARLLGCRSDEILLASTGVIGVPLPYEKIVAVLPALKAGLAADGWEAAARAIATTDTFAKGASREAKIGSARVAISGIAKGSGMIAPNMGTMLAFVFTDARLPAPVLRTLVRAAGERSFNSITVDGDTSTSDTVLVFATGAAAPRAAARKASDPVLADFRSKLEEVMVDLAHQIVRDGEGASKFVAIDVQGAASDGAARRIGLSIANSPLVKTAIAGSDANWGRIVAAVGKAGEKAVRDRIKVWIGGVPVAARGMVVPGYDEAPVARHMQGREIAIAVDVGVGRGRATVWTCDLTHAYIDINADYRS